MLDSLSSDELDQKCHVVKMCVLVTDEISEENTDIDVTFIYKDEQQEEMVSGEMYDCLYPYIEKVIPAHYCIDEAPECCATYTSIREFLNQNPGAVYVCDMRDK